MRIKNEIVKIFKKCALTGQVPTEARNLFYSIS